MKLMIPLSFIISVSLLFTCCAPRKSGDFSSGKPSSMDESGFSSTNEALSIDPRPQASHSASSAKNTLPAQSGESAVFSLASAGVEGKAMKVGDAIGGWTLADLDITYSKDTNSIKMLKALFSGQVTLKGAITRSNILDDSYDFLIAEEDQGKIPRYISPEGEKNVAMFLLDIPEDFKNKPKLEHGRQMNCRITIGSYKYIFAYMMAPDSAVLVSIEELPETAVDLTGFTVVGYDDEPGDLKYQIELTEEAQEELQALLEVDRWTPLSPENRPQHGLNCVLRAIDNDRVLSVFEFDAENCMIGIAAGGNMSTYWAPSQVAEKSKSFMERLRGQ